MNKKFTVVIYNIDGTHEEVYQSKQLKRAFDKAFNINLRTQKAVIYELTEMMRWDKENNKMDYTGSYMENRVEWGNKDIQTITNKFDKYI